ncbi:toxin Tbo-IT2-like [Liolophura sinensis]|uniref:toxin Tbo-IT2-like n=1 Tax=Liolophura sinensis TaxID=3198878 RepID=UPI0031588971
MKVVIVLGFFIMVVGVSYAQSWMEEADDEFEPEENSYVDSYDMDKREMLLKVPKCMFNTMPCVANSRRRFARCCRGLTCRCNFFGTNCRCVRKMTS